MPAVEKRGKNTDTREKELISFKVFHPSGYRPSAGMNFPGGGVPPIGPEIAVDWWFWEHTLKEFSEFKITKTVKIVTVWCKEERNCETLRWNYEDEEVNESERLIDQYKKWIHRKLYSRY